MTLVVTGGAGFIGSCFVRMMLEKYPQYRVVCVDKLTYAGSLDNLGSLLDDPRFSFEKVDICDREAIFAIFSRVRPGVVVNFAAESHVDRSIDDPYRSVRTNYLGTQVLLDASMEFGARRFHQVSTDEVYGDLPLDQPHLLFSEDSPLRPSSPYSASKAAADLLALSYERTYGLPVTVSRCSNNYGPCQHPEKLIPRMILNALEGAPLPVYGTGMNIRDWIYVEDHCAAIDRIIHGGVPGEVYNVGCRCEHTNLDLVRLICRELDRPESLIHFVEDRKGHDLRYGINPEKLRLELGWEPETDFTEGLKATIRWYLDHQDWLQKMRKSLS